MKNQPWNNAPTRSEVNHEAEWNMWSTRQPPFNSLEQGDSVFLASPDGRGGSKITWEVEVTRVITASYASKVEAWRLLRTNFQPVASMSRSWFLADEYTRQAPDAGWLLGWSYRAIRPIGVPRPQSLRFRPNGWLHLTESDPQLRKLGILPRASGQNLKKTHNKRPPRQVDPLKRLAVEMRAMAVARAYLIKKGPWTAGEIHDTSATKPYDFECVHGRRVQRIEVKGLSGGLGPVTLTRREVEHARTSTVPVTLIVVHGIKVEATKSGYRGTCGTAEAWDPWHVDDGTLRPAAYEYSLPTAD